MPDEIPPRVIASIAFVGRSSGQVKTLAGFKKGHHSIPDAANAVTNAFLGKICGPELSDEAERLFQAIRVGLEYKRKDLVLAVTSPLATLTAKDFTIEIAYALEEREPARFAVTTTLRELRDIEVARGEAFSRIFAGMFSEISLSLQKGARVEGVIDVIEGLNREGGISVNYPSDYRDCVIRVEGVDADVRCTGASLDLIFPRSGSPAELIDAFASVREAFQISKALRALVG
jgi:hypothetical protein